MEKLFVSNIDLNTVQNNETIATPEFPSSSASVAMELGALAMKFSRIERVPRYDEKTRENAMQSIVLCCRWLLPNSQ